MEEKTDPNVFELDLKFLGNDLVSFRMAASNVTSRWIYTILLTVVITSGTVATFGPSIVDMIKAI